MKKKRLAIVLASIAIIAAIGGTYASFISSSNPIEKDVTAPELGITINQIVSEEALESGKITQEDGKLSYMGAVPGTVVSEKVNVTTGAKSTDCYVRVAVYRNWTDVQGEKIVDEELIDTKGIGIETIDRENWIILEPEDDAEVIYFYYKKPLKAGESTTNLMDSFSILTDSLSDNSNAYAGLGVHLEFVADAVQKAAGKDAMLSEWGIEAVFDGDNLVGFEEQ